MVVWVLGSSVAFTGVVSDCVAFNVVFCDDGVGSGSVAFDVVFCGKIVISGSVAFEVVFCSDGVGVGSVEFWGQASGRFSSATQQGASGSSSEHR